MRLPKTSRPAGTAMSEVVLGKGDYVAGGAHSLPFLDLDSARRRRPLVFGEVLCNLSEVSELAAGMFSGRHTDPEEWSVMWREIGADGVCLRLGPTAHDQDASVSLVRKVEERSRLPVYVCGCGDNTVDVPLMERIASDINDSVLILGSSGPVMSMALAQSCGIHAVIARAKDGEALADLEGMMCQHTSRIIAQLDQKALGDGIETSMAEAEDIRARGISGGPGAPLLCDVTGAWESVTEQGGDEYASVRRVSLTEATAALAMMLSGADIVVVRGPGAADMARVYGEELADL